MKKSLRIRIVPTCRQFFIAIFYSSCMPKEVIVVTVLFLFLISCSQPLWSVPLIPIEENEPAVQWKFAYKNAQKVLSEEAMK